MKRMATAVFTVLAALTFVFAAVAEAELRSEPWACFARGYILDLSAAVVGSSLAVQPRSIRGRMQPLQVGSETHYSFSLYDIVATDEGSYYLRYVVHVIDVDEGFASMIAKAAGGEFPVELANYGGKCPVDGRHLRGANTIRLLDHDLEPMRSTPATGSDRG